MAMPALLAEGLCVAAGGAIGSLGRWGLMATGWFDSGRIWHTVTVNLIGAFLIGALWQICSSTTVTRHIQPFLFTGILGGFTTFSTLALDTTRLLSAGDALRADIYLAISLAGGIAACIIGIWAAKTILT